MNKSYSIIAWLTGLLTLALAIFAFILSFNALTDLALKHGVSIPPLFPFVVEFAVVIFSLNALYRSLNNESAKWQWTLIIMSSLLAGTFNIIHADIDMVSKAMAAMPSLFLLLSFESFVSLLKNGIKRSQQIGLISSLDTTIANRQSQLSTMDDTIDTLQDKLHTVQQQVDSMNAPKDEVSTRREKMITLIHNYKAEYGKPPTQQYLSEQTGVSIGTTRKDMKALNGVVK